VSVRPAGSTQLGTKTELKNMNSFAFLERGTRAEIERQIELLRTGQPVEQQTLHFDPATGRLTPLRSKEEAHDYRYFPEPDLVPILAGEEMLAAAGAEIPELPAQRSERFMRDLGLSPDRARELAFRAELGDYFERAVAAAGRDGASAGPVEIANWIPQLVERIGSATDPAASRVSPESLAQLAEMVAAKHVSRDAAREVLSLLVQEGGDPRAIVEREGLSAMRGDDGLTELVDRAIASDQAAAEQVKGGNIKAIGPLVGFVMRETKGRADGGEVTKLIRERLAAQ
jgi:aspartyl-tRNA(Asn)/glutamyl-tRNA(Gln) amidotransferase subunit B